MIDDERALRTFVASLSREEQKSYREVTVRRSRHSTKEHKKEKENVRNK